MTRMNEAAAIGQAIWLDFIRRSFLDSGELGGLVGQGFAGRYVQPVDFPEGDHGQHRL